MIIKLEKIINTTIPNENRWFKLIQGPTFIIKLDRIANNNTTSKCMVQIGSRTNIYHKIGQTTNTTIPHQNAWFKLVHLHQHLS
jgi:hypothetical protein